MEEEGVKSGIHDLSAEHQAVTARTLCRQGPLVLSETMVQVAADGERASWGLRPLGDNPTPQNKASQRNLIFKSQPMPCEISLSYQDEWFEMNQFNQPRIVFLLIPFPVQFKSGLVCKRH